MEKTTKQYQEYHNCGILGFPGQKLLLPPWQLQNRTQTELHIINLYRKIIMTLHPTYKLKIKSISSTNPDLFLVQEFLETRFKQVPISQDNNDSVYIIDVVNKTGQEQIITTDHIRIKSTNKSAITEEKLCDSFILFKLGINKHIKIELFKEKLSPISDDKHRCCMFVAYDTKEQILAEEKSEQIIFTSKRAISEYKFFSFGGFRLQDLKQQYCTNITLDILSKIQSNLVIIDDDNQQTVIFNQFPDMFISPIINELESFIYDNYKSAIPTKTNDNQYCIIFQKRYDQTETIQIKQVIIDTLQNIQKKINQFEVELASDIDSFIQ